MLNMTKLELDLISESEMYLFFEKSMRGGVSYISKRYSKGTISIWNIVAQSNNQNILYT